MDDDDQPNQIAGIRRDILAATALLTRLPVAHTETGASDPARCYWAFGLAGLVVSVPAAVLGALLIGIGVPSLAAGAVVMGGIALLTGGMHLDGLADTADGLGGRDREHRLAIMRDSGTGGFGTVGLLAVGVAYIASVAALSDSGAATMVGGVVAAACLSRSMMAIQRWRHEPPSEEGLAHRTGRPQPVVAAISVAVAMVVAIVFGGPGAALAALLAGLAVTLALGAFLEYWIGGVNGDGLGATQQLSEAIMLMLLCAMAG